MATLNPYQSPRAAVADTGEEYQPVKIFSVSGRVGRARYIAYTIGLSFLVSLAIGIVAGVLAGVTRSNAAMGVLTFAAWALIIVISIMLSIQRCHDFNATGWLAILALVPLVNLIFWFIPGTDGPNRYGAPPPPNTTLTIVAAAIVPMIAIVGILAAIALPAYQNYVKRAQQTQQR